MSEEIKAKNLIPGDEIRHNICGWSLVKKVYTGFIHDLGIRTVVTWDSGSQVYYYPNDYIQIN